MGNIKFPDAVPYDADFVYTLAIDFLRIVNVDFLHEFTDNLGGQFLNIGIFSDDG